MGRGQQSAPAVNSPGVLTNSIRNTGTYTYTLTPMARECHTPNASPGLLRGRGLGISQIDRPRAFIETVTPALLLFLLLAVTPAPSGAIAAQATGDPSGQHHSPAAQVTADNVSRLDVAWTHRNGDMAAAKGEPSSVSAQSTPILLPREAGEHLVYCTPFNRIIALDPQTGRERWRFDPRVPRTSSRPYRCRGVAYTEVPAPDERGLCKHRLYTATADRRLIAIDARTGRRCTGFGTDGEVELIESERYGLEKVGTSSAPVAANGVVVVGSSVIDFAYAEAPRGLVAAYDAVTGAPRWSFDPLQGQTGTGAANAWAPLAVDAANDLVFVPTGAPSPDYYGVLRPGRNGYANSVVALRLSTGEVAWAFQLVHHDLWDYDTPAQPILFEWRAPDGQRVPALAQVSKQGFVFVLDRRTGQPLLPVEERRVPASTIPGEQAWPTQPFPVRPTPMLPTRLAPEDAWGLTFWDRGKCRDAIAGLRNEGIFTPLAEQPTLLFPGSLGGANWGGGAYSPQSGRLIVNVNAAPFVAQLIPGAGGQQKQDHPVAGQKTMFVTMQGTPYTLAVGPLLSPLGIPCTAPPWGKLVSIDLGTGDVAWEAPLGSIHEMGPFPLPWHINWGTPNLGGGVVTDGGLFFIAATMDRQLRAFDVRDGRQLWTHRLPVDATATPMSYTHLGRQFVVVNAGGHAMYNRGTGDYLIAFALPVNPKHDPPRNLPWPLSEVSAGQARHEVLPDGRIHLTIEHRPLPGVTPEMLAWWYRVLPLGQVEFSGTMHPLYHLFHPFEHGRIWIEAPAADGQPGVGAGGIVARYEWFGPYDSKGSARVVELSPQRFVTRPRMAGLTFGEFRHEWGVSAEGATYRVDNLIGVDWPVIGPWVNLLLRRYIFSEGMLREWERHQVEEVGLLPHFLPMLYAQRNDENIYHLGK
jgi:quinoprotein glucose dehydrogenase